MRECYRLLQSMFKRAEKLNPMWSKYKLGIGDSLLGTAYAELNDMPGSFTITTLKGKVDVMYHLGKDAPGEIDGWYSPTPYKRGNTWVSPPLLTVEAFEAYIKSLP